MRSMKFIVRLTKQYVTIGVINAVVELRTNKWVLCNVDVFTFIFVTFWLDAKDCHDHDDDHDGGGGQGHQEPRLAIERLRLEVTVLQESFGRGLDLKNKFKSTFKVFFLDVLILLWCFHSIPIICNGYMGW